MQYRLCLVSMYRNMPVMQRGSRQNAGFVFLTSAEQVVAKDQTEYNNTKSKKITVQKQHNGHADGNPE